MPDPQRFVTVLLDLLEAEKFTGRAMVQSFDWRTLRLVQKLAPSIPTVYLSLQKGKAPTGLVFHRGANRVQQPFKAIATTAEADRHTRMRLSVTVTRDRKKRKMATTQAAIAGK